MAYSDLYIVGANVDKPGGAIQANGIDDQDTINVAIASLPVNGGRIFLAGEFLVSGPILVQDKDNVTLEGLSPGDRTASSLADTIAIGTRIRAVSGFTGNYIVDVRRTAADRPLHSVVLRDLTIDGDSIAGPIGGVYFSSYRGGMENVHVRECTGDGITVEGVSGWTTYNSVFHNLHIAENDGDGLVFAAYSPDCHVVSLHTHSNGGSGVVITTAHQNMHDMHSYNNTDYGIHFLQGGSYSLLTGSSVRDNLKHGIYMQATTAGITGCVLDNLMMGPNSEGADNTYNNIMLEPGGGQSIQQCVFNNLFFVPLSVNGPQYNVRLNGANAKDNVFSNMRWSATSFVTASISDNGDRNLINGWGTNAGVPGSAGDWASTAWEGAMVRDTVTGLLYVYQGGAWRMF